MGIGGGKVEGRTSEVVSLMVTQVLVGAAVESFVVWSDLVSLN
jgi:hypothetical protein